MPNCQNKLARLGALSQQCIKLHAQNVKFFLRSSFLKISDIISSHQNDALLDKNFVSRWLRLVGFSYSLRISFFLSLQGSAGLPRRSPRPPALVREGFSSEEHIEPGLGSTRCTSSPPPSRSHACPPPTCWAEGSR